MTLSLELPLWDAPLLHCLSAGWALPEDMHCILPILAAAESVRNTCYPNLAAQTTPAIGQLLARAHEAGGYGGMLQVWQAEQETLAPASLPSFALYFVQQCNVLCGTRDIPAALAFLLVLETAAERIGAALQRAHQKKLQLPSADSADAPPAAVQALEEALVLCGGAADGASLDAIALFERLFEDLYQAMRHQRIASLCTKIQAKKSLLDPANPVQAMSLDSGEWMREERDDKRNQQFSVARLPCQSEALDPRVVKIAPGKLNNLHKHAHETLFCVLQGSGKVLIGDNWVEVKTGESVFAPRWAMHQTHNTGDCEMIMMAITDFYLSNKVFIGKTSTTVI